MIGINNLGEIPATGVQLKYILVGGVPRLGEPDKDYPATNQTTEEGVTISAGGIIRPPDWSDFPDGMIFFPKNSIRYQ